MSKQNAVTLLWGDAADELLNLLQQLPGSKFPYDLGHDAQHSLARYVAPPGYWTERLERKRQYFVKMERKQFQLVYATLLRELGV
jgi:hypothetical protein